MMLLDVNVLVAAHRPEIQRHAEVKRWLEDVMAEGRAFGAADGVYCGFVRVVTQRPFAPTTPINGALDFISLLRAQSNCRRVAPTQRQWEIFDQICRERGFGGKVAQDAYWASFALDLDCDWITLDRGFERIPGLRWRNPLEAQARTNPR